MKLKKLTMFALAVFVAATFSLTGCKKDKGGGDDGDGEIIENEKGPKLQFYSTGTVGDIYWIYENTSRDAGVALAFGFWVTHDIEVGHIEFKREVIAGPGKGEVKRLWDSTLNSSYPTKTLVKKLDVGEKVEGVREAQTCLYKLIATDVEGNTSEISVTVKPIIQLEERTGFIWNREEDGAFDLTQGISIDKSIAKNTHDIELVSSGNGFKFVSGNGSKFKLYNGSAVGLNRFQTYDELEKEWNKVTNELTETPELDEDPSSYKFIMIKSTQNNKVYFIQVYAIEDDSVEFDYIGEIG